MADTYTLLIAESSLELFPSSLLADLRVRNYFRRIKKSPSEVILDFNFHSNFMSSLPNSSKRGRPDIPHLGLLASFGSLLSKEGRLHVFIHTVNDLIIEFYPTIHIPKSLDRFKGLMVQLFKEKRVPSDSDPPLMSLSSSSLSSFLRDNRSRYDLIVEFSRQGEFLPSYKYAPLFAEGCSRPLFIFGGFAHGRLNIDPRFVDYRISISSYGLELFSAIAHVLTTVYNFEEQQKKIEKKDKR